ncbi:unnamed protein product [Paramecium sonneborni]|uniref:Uncharacterized protein n=1 Tax=Paramecium sonneborni TaxID=65129 RepID=A0A8S1QPZ4_9CILI|nr:unnamed protein product [Paramecium sonneborni]
MLDQYVFHLIVQPQHLAVHITQSVYGMQSQDNNTPFRMIIVTESTQYAILLMVLHIRTGQKIAKLDGHTHPVIQVRFSLMELPGTSDNSICCWDVESGQQILLSDKLYKVKLAQFGTPLFSNTIFPKIITWNTILLISQTPIFSASGVLILNGQFVNQQGEDL